jgi:hypothetical protein
MPGPMVPLASNGSSGAKGTSGKGSDTSGSNASSSRPRVQGGISFVAFDAGISKETRKAVRVQAAKASAGARKATIARKLAARKQNEDEAQNAEKAVQAAEPVQSIVSKQPSEHGRATLMPDPRKPTFATIPCAQQSATRSPSVVSLRSSKAYFDNNTGVTRVSRPITQAVTDRALVSSPRPGSHARSCHCDKCQPHTPAWSAATSQDILDSFEVGIGDQLETMRAIAKYAVPRPSTISTGRHDPFNCYPVPWQPWYDGLLHYMMTVFAPRAWPILNITSDQGTRWEWFMTQHAMEEPALFYVRLLFASGDLIRIGVLNRDCSYWLQTQAIKAINEALQDPRRSTGDGLILAVGRIALHECMYGDRNAANTIHRPAQRRMIDMRGGMPRLGFPELVTRLMRWADRVMTMQGNTSRLLPDDEDEGNYTYNLKQSIDGFEAWAPATGQALRNKMAIANLLTDD